MNMINRRQFLQTSALTTLGLGAMLHAQDVIPLPIKLALKFNMVKYDGNLAQTFAMLQEIGYDGVELDSPGGQNKIEALAAAKASGLPVHGVVDSIHWRTRLSDPDQEVREKALQGLLTAMRESKSVGGTSVLLVPAVVDEKTNHDQAWQRSIEQIRKALPLAEELQIHILIENVWNQFLYDPKGANDQNAAMLCKYIDEIGSPWVGSYFDIGNHQKFGKPGAWIRQLGKRIVKLDCKDWGVKGGFGKIGEGDVDWADVRAALREIKYQGWATAEVAGGGPDVCREILQQMRKHLLGLA